MLIPIILLSMITATLGQAAPSVVFDGAEIGSIKFTGNEAISNSDLKDLLTIHARILWGIRAGSPYNFRQVNREKAILANYYRQFGFLDAVVNDTLTALEKNRIKVEFRITEGKQYYLKGFNLRGNKVIPTADYIRELKLRPGIPFSRYEIQNGLQRLVRRYETIGYPGVFIQDSVAVSDSVELFIKIFEGDFTRIGRVVIGEAPGVEQSIIKREVVIGNGDMYNIDLIEESQRRLFETGLFNGVNITSSDLDTVADIVNLNIDLIMSKFRSVDFDFGLKQEALKEYADPLLNLNVEGGWRHKNIDQAGRKLQVSLSASTRFPEIYLPQKFRGDIIFTEPWLLKFRTPTSVNPFFEYQDWSGIYGAGSFHRKYGLQITSLYRWFRTVQARGQLEWSKVQTQGISNEEDKPIEQRIYSLILRLDRKNNFFTPSEGYLFEIKPKLMGAFLGGTHHFVQLETSYSRYHRLFGHVVGAARVVTGITRVLPQDTSGVVPINHRFYLGGNSSVRGYQNQQLGPLSLEEGNIVPLGGNFEVYGNFEIRFPIVWIIGGEFFMDWGNLWTDPKFANIGDIKLATGFGITFATPIGPARIDFGKPLNDSSYGTGWNIHVAISHAF